MKVAFRGLACGLAALLAGPALAQDSQLEAARRCTGITDSLERLVCYDRALAPTPSVPALGAEQVEQQARKERESAVREADARVAAVTERTRGMVRISLDNGQVWDQVETSTRFDIKVGDTLRITKGAMGSYRMARVGNGTSGWVGARRRE